MLIPVFQHRIINMESSSTHTVQHVKAFRLKPFGGKNSKMGSVETKASLTQTDALIPASQLLPRPNRSVAQI